MLVENGAHLKLGPGAILQFGNNQADDVYAEIQRIFLQYNGTFETAGTAEKPVTIKPSDLFPSTGTVITQCPGYEGCTYTGVAEFSYTNFFNPMVRGKKADHVNVTRTILNDYVRYRTQEEQTSSCNPQFDIYDNDSNEASISYSRFRRLGQERGGGYQNGVKPYGGCTWNLGATGVETSLIENTMLGGFPTGNSSRVTGSVMLNNNQRWASYDGLYITRGSDFYLYQPQTSDLLVLDVHNYEGKSYALLFSYIENHYSSGSEPIASVDRVSGMAELVGRALVRTRQTTMREVENVRSLAGADLQDRTLGTSRPKIGELALDIDCDYLGAGV